MKKNVDKEDLEQYMTKILLTPAKGLSPCRELHTGKESKSVGKLLSGEATINRSRGAIKVRYLQRYPACITGCIGCIRLVRELGVAKRVVGVANQLQCPDKQSKSSRRI